MEKLESEKPLSIFPHSHDYYEIHSVMGYGFKGQGHGQEKRQCSFHACAIQARHPCAMRDEMRCTKQVTNSGRLVTLGEVGVADFAMLLMVKGVLSRILAEFLVKRVRFFNLEFCRSSDRSPLLPRHGVGPQFDLSDPSRDIKPQSHRRFAIHFVKVFVALTS